MLTRAASGAMRVMLFCCVVVAGPSHAQEIELGLPIACELGETCWVQQYVDRDPGSGVRDYACGAQTYDGHDGTDIRIRHIAERGVSVLAAAAGTVKAARDGMPDLLIRTEQDKQLVKNRECGNGVVIDHEGGWQTQYCHMRVGSLKVKAGDTVANGAALGEVGHSGEAGFPHVHLTVRKDGKAVDPFRANGTACGKAEGALWAPKALQDLAYREGEVIGIGFTPGPVEMEALEDGKLDTQPPAPDWPALVAYGWAINLQGGDEITIALEGPSGTLAENTATLDRHKAQYMLFSGKKRPDEGWAAGNYMARITVVRSGKTVVDKTLPATLP